MNTEQAKQDVLNNYEYYKNAQLSGDWENENIDIFFKAINILKKYYKLDLITDDVYKWTLISTKKFNIGGKDVHLNFTKSEHNKFGIGLRSEFDFGEIKTLSFQEMLQFCNFFGTEAILSDGWTSCEGCETCGHGFRFTITIEIYKITKNEYFLNFVGE